MKRRSLAITGVVAIALALAWPSAALAATPTMSSIVVADNALTAGETTLVTFTFSEAVHSFDAADITAANGTLGPITSSDAGTTWTSTFTPNSGVTEATNIITVDLSSVFDIATNTAGSGTADSNDYAIDTERPSGSIIVASSSLSIGETATVTIAFSEAVIGFDNADLTVPNGTLSTVSSTDAGITWTATLSPDANITDATNFIILDLTGVEDNSGNIGVGTASSSNYEVDTERPTATAVIADTTLSVSETSTVTITFSEAVIGFDNADLTVPNGTLSTVSSTDAGITWTATYTPDGTSSTGNVFVVNLAGVTDTAGNDGNGTINSNAFAVQAAAVQPADILPVTGAQVHQLPIIALVLTASGLGMFVMARRRGLDKLDWS